MAEESALDDKRNDGTDAGQRIIQATIRLLALHGREQVTTRAVAAEAGVQAPAIYRLFGDKQGLLDAVAEYGFTSYLDRKRVDAPGGDPIGAFRAGWDLHVEFGLENPALFSIMYGDPGATGTSPAATRAYAVLRERMHGLAAAGLLRVPEQRAADMVGAAGCGTVFMLLATSQEERRAGLSVAMREAVVAAVTVRDGADRPSGLAAAAILLRALLPGAAGLSNGERTLMGELLDRLGAEEDDQTGATMG